jgi:hypothetical protein
MSGQSSNGKSPKNTSRVPYSGLSKPTIGTRDSIEKEVSHEAYLGLIPFKEQCPYVTGGGAFMFCLLDN